MDRNLKIAVVTGTRADYGILKPVIREVQQSPHLNLQLLVTGAHLEDRFGFTAHEIEQNGFAIHKKLPIDLSSDNEVSVTKSMGRAMMAFAEVYAESRPDIILLLGDRFEIFAATTAALIARIPVAHLAGGDVTEGAIDEAMRHSITKMAHLHFVTNAKSAKRVMQLGENPSHIFNVGNPSLDEIKNMTFLTKDEIGSKIKFDFREKNFLITFHPETIERNKAKEHIKEMLAALKNYPDVGLVFTMPNADPEGAVIAREIEKFVQENKNAASYDSLGHNLYFNVMKVVDLVIGNSSSGLLEAPSFNLPCVNIGNRQVGRMQSALTLQVNIDREAIIRSIDKAMAMERKEIENPYGDGKSAKRIVSILNNIKQPQNLLKKKFFDMEVVSDA